MVGKNKIIYCNLITKLVIFIFFIFQAISDLVILENLILLNFAIGKRFDFYILMVFICLWLTINNLSHKTNNVMDNQKSL